VDPARIAAVACSNKPRPVEGSYMPVFKAGIGMAESIAASLQVPVYMFSHQEGHIAAIKSGTPMEKETEFLCYHLSGGTCELLKVTDEGISIIGNWHIDLYIEQCEYGCESILRNQVY
jgi:N6-L-threonylcarbamoyladenine synthase